jgi:hypothetical protein
MDKTRIIKIRNPKSKISLIEQSLKRIDCTLLLILLLLLNLKI